jgi:hypothetical protein
MTPYQHKKQQYVMQAELQRLAFNVAQEAMVEELKKLKSPSVWLRSGAQGVSSVLPVNSQSLYTVMRSILVIGTRYWPQKVKWLREIEAIRVGYASAKGIAKKWRFWAKKKSGSKVSIDG